MDYALEVKNLSKHFRRVRAVDDLSFTVPEGVICAFIGANGAGKTTTYSLVGGFLRPNSGEILIDGEVLPPCSKIENRIGILPQDIQFFDERSVGSQLSLFARLSGYSKREARDEVERVLTKVNLSDKKRNKPRALSHGMKVRLGIAQAIIGEPPLILLDEPLAGLDPVMRSEIKEVIRDLKERSTVMVSSHELGELESFCDYIVAIHHGRLLFSGEIEEILAKNNEESIEGLYLKALSNKPK